jgi:hypothetical protein
MSDEEPLMTVATFDSPTAAEIARTFLDAEGIRSFVADGEVVGALSILSGAVGGVKLKVAKSDFLAAERLLNNQRGRYDAEPRDDYGLPLQPDAITRERPPAKPMRDSRSPEEGDDTGEPESAEETRKGSVDDLLTKAMLVAVLGLVICPVVAQAYSLHLLGQAEALQVPLSPRQNFFLRSLQIFNTLVLAGAIFLTVILWATR